MHFAPVTRPKYLGAALPADSDTEPMFTTIGMGGAGWTQQAGIKKFLLRLNNDQAGTVKAYKSENRGVTWVQVDEAAVAIASATVDNKYELVVETFLDWKVDWVNGGVTQTAFGPTIALSTERT